MASTIEKLKECKAELGEFAKARPEIVASLSNMLEDAFSEKNVLDAKTMELITIAVAVARKCEPCILVHTESAIKVGVTREELATALNAAVLICGGPGWAYAGKALRIYDDIVAANEAKQ